MTEKEKKEEETESAVYIYNLADIWLEEKEKEENEDDEYPSICRSYNNLLQHLTLAPHLATKELYEVIEKTLAHSIILIAICKQNPFLVVGAGSVFLEQKVARLGSTVGHIEDIVTHPSFRNRGIGKQIVHALIDAAKQQFHCYKIILDCATKNIGFYERCGFKQSAVQMSIYLNNIDHSLLDSGAPLHESTAPADSP